MEKTERKQSYALRFQETINDQEDDDAQVGIVPYWTIADSDKRLDFPYEDDPEHPGKLRKIEDAVFHGPWFQHPIQNVIPMDIVQKIDCEQDLEYYVAEICPRCKDFSRVDLVYWDDNGWALQIEPGEDLSDDDHYCIESKEEALNPHLYHKCSIEAKEYLQEEENKD